MLARSAFPPRVLVKTAAGVWRARSTAFSLDAHVWRRRLMMRQKRHPTNKLHLTPLSDAGVSASKCLPGPCAVPLVLLLCSCWPQGHIPGKPSRGFAFIYSWKTHKNNGGVIELKEEIILFIVSPLRDEDCWRLSSYCGWDSQGGTWWNISLWSKERPQTHTGLNHSVGLSIKWVLHDTNPKINSWFTQSELPGFNLLLQDGLILTRKLVLIVLGIMSVIVNEMDDEWGRDLFVCIGRL